LLLAVVVVVLEVNPLVVEVAALEVCSPELSEFRLALFIRLPLAPEEHLHPHLPQTEATVHFLLLPPRLLAVVEVGRTTTTLTIRLMREGRVVVRLITHTQKPGLLVKETPEVIQHHRLVTEVAAEAERQPQAKAGHRQPTATEALEVSGLHHQGLTTLAVEAAEGEPHPAVLDRAELVVEAMEAIQTLPGLPELPIKAVAAVAAGTREALLAFLEVMEALALWLSDMQIHML
jgi:hypothetical protein